MAIKLTEKANTEIKRIIAEGKANGKCPAEADIVLRVAVVGASCAGLQYGMGLEGMGAITTEDIVFEEDGVKTVVWSEHDEILHGTEIDFDEGTGGFIINNPNAPQHGCHGCSHEGEECGDENPTD